MTFGLLLQACEELRLGPVCICLAINYLDRFLSVHDLPVSYRLINLFFDY